MFRDIVAIGRDVDRRGSRHVGSILIGADDDRGPVTARPMQNAIRPAAR